MPGSPRNPGQQTDGFRSFTVTKAKCDEKKDDKIYTEYLHVRDKENKMKKSMKDRERETQDKCKGERDFCC